MEWAALLLGLGCARGALAEDAAAAAAAVPADDADASLAWRLLTAAEALSEQPGGAWVFLGMFIALYVLTVPCTILETAGGYFFGFRHGMLLGLAGKMIGTATSMLLARTVLLGWVRRSVATRSTFRILERMVQNSGFTGIFLSRLLPNIVKNYGMAVIDVPFSRLATAVVLNNIPFSLLWAYVGSSAHDAVSLLRSTSLGSQVHTTGKNKIKNK